MAAPATKKAPAKAPAPAAATATTPKTNGEEEHVILAKPDQAAYNKEQDELKAQIDALQPKINAIKEQIALTTKNGPGADRRTELRAEMDSIKGQQSGIKGSRSKLLEQIKAIQESTSKRSKDLQASKQKTPFKSVEDIETHIKNLERQIESGSLKLVEEKKALADISTSKRSRRAVEGFQAEQEAIDADRARADELRKQLDDPESKAISDRYEAIKAELDSIKVQSDEAYANRNKLFDQRKELSTQLDDLWARKKEANRAYKEAGDRYWKKVQDERAKKAERYAAQRQAQEDEKRKEIAEQLREEAEAPAFQAQIEDCQTLIDYLNAKAGGDASETVAPALNLGGARAEIAGVPKLETREIDAAAHEGLVARKKKGEDEENYFVGGKGKKKGGAKGGAPSPTTPTPSGNDKVNLPLSTLSALLALSIPPPASTSDITRTIQDLKTKKEWFEANQKRVTAENISKADAEIKRLQSGSASKGTNTPKTAEPANINNTDAEKPAEPAPTPAVTDSLSNGVSSEAVDEKIEAIKEADEES